MTVVDSPVATVEAEVRELVRRRGVHPVQDRLAVRRLVDEVVSDYDERALTSSLPPLPDPRVAARAVYDAVTGFGRSSATSTTRRSRRSASSTGWPGGTRSRRSVAAVRPPSRRHR